MALTEDLTSLWRARRLLVVLIQREVASRHAGTVAGVVWPYLQPLLVIAAYYLVLDGVFAMRLGPEAPVREVGAYLIVGALPWMAFCDAMSRGANSILDAGSILQKNALPTVLYPVRAVLASGSIYGPLLLLITLCYGHQHHFSWALLMLVPLLVLQTLLTTLLAYLLAVFNVALRDTAQLLNFFLSVGIYLSPVLFPISLFPEDWRWTLWFNPMTAIVLGYQEILLKGQMPPLHLWGIILLWTMIIVAMLEPVLKHSKDQLIDWL